MHKCGRLLLLLACLISAPSWGQNIPTIKSKDSKSELTIVPLPAIAYNPTSGLLFGLAPSASWYMGEKSNTRISSALGSLIYTTKNQWILTAKSNVFLDGDSWNLLGDWRFFITSQPTYGLGTGPQSGKPIGTGIEYEDGLFSKPISDAQMMEFNFFRFHETLLKRIQDSYFYTGLGYHFDNHNRIEDNLLDVGANPPLYTSHYSYNSVKGISTENYSLSGFSVNALYDSRDNAINPYSGRYAFANIRANYEWLGSAKNSSLLWLEYRDYFSLNKNRPRHMIAVWTYGWFVTSGDVPYMNLPALGWDQFGRSGRAYTQGRFRGEDIVYAEVEYRVPLQRDKERFGAVAFVNTTSASNRLGNIDLFDYLDVGYGVGFRFMISEASRSNLNIDFAFGEYGATGFYFGINEVF
ncbi:outer membrane protein assembly factor [Reichenbachiella ulvae]|uniref:Outer membrane protein assembly factor n=1 Tax=Reichenbachiella ulvae TaxID=2980104 RepID=A0ABT3CXG8_9BACT|nr:outer membrane protein assembly factor [Reichenbachiella ulvae]MCV9388400.1 outer membrane protein assembly factor [Reichenbachiella ulvae]